MSSAHPLSRDLDHVLARTEALWRAMEGSHFLVTGGTGFIGSWLLDSLFWTGERLGLSLKVTVLTRNPIAFAAKYPWLSRHRFLRLLEGDVRDFQFPREPVTHIIHAAFDSGRAIADSLLAFETLVDGTRRVLECAASHPVQRMLFVSSGAVYGPQPADLACLGEEFTGGPDSASPSSVYGEGKRAAEQLCAIAVARGLAITIARCFSFIGPRLPLDSHFAAGNFLRDAFRGRDIVVNGDGRPERSYLYAADLAIWLWTIFHCGKVGRPYNVGGRAAITIASLAELIAGRVSPVPAVRITGIPRDEPAPRYVPCVHRAGSELGLHETVALPEGIDRTLRWMRGNAEARQ